MKRNLFLLFALLINTLVTDAQSEGPLNPMTAAYSVFGCLACPGGEWNNLQNLTYTDHQYADVILASYPSCFQSTCFYSRTLYAYDFGFSIPQNAAITGVTAEVLRMSTASTGISDSSIQLYTGSPVGNNHASSIFWTPNPMNVLYGDSTDLWGYQLTPDSVNNILFGLAVLVFNKDSAASFSTASVDHIEMTVYYNTGTGIQSQTKYSRMLGVTYNAVTSALELYARNEKINAVRINGITGEEIFSEKLVVPANEKLSLAIPRLTQGIYFLVADLNGKMVTRKFTVN